MTKINIEQPHGYLLDSNDIVVKRFGNWETGTHMVPEKVDSVAYVSGPAAHTTQTGDEYAP